MYKETESVKQWHLKCSILGKRIIQKNMDNPKVNFRFVAGSLVWNENRRTVKIKGTSWNEILSSTSNIYTISNSLRKLGYS